MRFPLSATTSQHNVQRSHDLLALPDDLRGRIGYGLYGGLVQYFIVGVDGTLAQLGNDLPTPERLRRIVVSADKQHAILVRHHDRANVQDKRP